MNTPQESRFAALMLPDGKPLLERYPNWVEILRHMHAAIAHASDVGEPPREFLSAERRFRQFLVEQMAGAPHLSVDPRTQIDDILPFVHDEFFGLGLFAAVLGNDRVEDIIMDSWERMDVLVGGQKQSLKTPFESEEDAYHWMQRMALKDGKKLSESEPIVACRLGDGSRATFVVPFVSPSASMVIRKHKFEQFDRDAYERAGVAPEEFFSQLSEWVNHLRQNILICGPTGSGKTTFANYVLSLIDDSERILVVEDTPEMQAPHPRVMYLRSLQRDSREGLRGDFAIELSDVLKIALRMRPDRVVVGETRGREAYAMLDAFATGHTGGLTTLHANSPAEAMTRLETLCAPAAENMPLAALRKTISLSIGIVIQIAVVPGSDRRVVVEATQMIHPIQMPIAGALDDPANHLTHEDLIERRLWLWNAVEQRLDKVADPVPLRGQYFLAD
jgi:pilus assembly protein CpaF